MAEEVPEYTQTLNDLISTAANDWGPELCADLVEALRTQRERWNAEQAVSSRKRVTSKQVTTTVKARPGGKSLNLSGLKL